MALQPSAGEHVDRTEQAPFLLRLFWRNDRPLDAHEFSVAPPQDPGPATDYYALLPNHVRSQSVEIYTWPSCTLRELTGLLTSVLAPGTLPEPANGTRLVYKFIFPDTRAQVSESGRGKWIDKPLGSVVIGEEYEDLAGESEKTLADARFVIGDYIACSIYPPDENGRAIPPPPPPGRPGGRDNGYRGGRGGGGGYRDRGYGNRDQGGPPQGGDWRRGDNPPGRGYGGNYGNGGGYGGGYNDGGYNGGGYGGGGGRGRPY